MHCSSCEPVLDRYLEGTLAPARMAQVAAHLKTCEPCTALLSEVKVVDALLFTTAVPELPQNFTFAVMAELQSMPAPRTGGTRIWSFLAIYSAAAWVAAIIWMAITGSSPGSVTANLLAAIERGGAAWTVMSSGLAQSFSHNAPTLAAIGFGVLTLDAILAGSVAALYFGVRPRLAAAMAHSREVSS